MAALLTSVLDSSTKVAEYIAECRSMGIELLPPDVNESGADFTVSGGNIRFGLVAIKGIGRGFIDALMKEREENGPFTALDEFCRRMYGHELNRRSVESLIRAGAFDSLGFKRKALLEVLDKVIEGVNGEGRRNIAGQMGLFDLGDEEDSGSTLQLPDVEEFSRRELMSMERETTGLYLSGHPMDEYRDRARDAGAVSIGAILSDFAEGQPERFSDNQEVTVAGVVTASKTRTTKSSSLMSYITLEDDTGSMELIAFQRALDQGGAYIKDDAALLIRGRISLRDEKEPQLMVDNIRPLSDLDKLPPPPRQEPNPMRQDQTLYVRLPSRDDPLFEKIKLILTMFPGDGRIVVYFEDTKKRMGAPCLLHEALIAELRERCGEANVVLK